MELGGSSPILKLTEKSIELWLWKENLNQNENNDKYKCFIAMRCWHPRAR